MACRIDRSYATDDPEERRRIIQEVSRISYEAELRKWLEEQERTKKAGTLG